jgi:fructokinase
MGNRGYLWGIDLGGSKIEGVICNRESPSTVVDRQRIDTEAARGYDHVLAQVVELVDRMARKSGLPLSETIGIGAPGTIDPLTGNLKNSNTLSLNGRPLQSDLEIALGQRVVMANDANCFALAEACFGAATSAGTVFGIILGTGVGGGIVVDQKVLAGRHGIAGEWGHNVLEENGASCYCGKRGCVETVLSGPGLEKFYAAATGRKMSLPEILECTDSDPAAAAMLDRLTTFFARAVAVMINILDPDAIVVGGGVGQVDALYAEQTRAKIASCVFNDSFTTPILKPLLGDSAGVFGAALLAHDLAQS